MNRWLRGLGLTFVLMSATSAVFAVCEAEQKKFRTLVINGLEEYSSMSISEYDEVRKQVLSNTEKHLEEMGASERKKREEVLLLWLKSPVGFKQRDLVEWEIELCQLRNFGLRASKQSAQQLTQPYKSGTSVLDRYLTAPKEDCDAIPQSYNVSDRQQAVSQCRIRNANRDKYAANANAASAQPATNVQSAQQKAQQAQQQAQQSQARADQARQGKRRQHEAENEAHQCLTIDATSSGFGSFVNKCNFKISYSFCNYKPKKDSWAEFHNCEGRAGNSDFVGPYGTNAAHVKNTETVYFFACKDPSWSLDTEYVPGQGLRGRCYTVGGN